MDDMWMIGFFSQNLVVKCMYIKQYVHVGWVGTRLQLDSIVMFSSPFASSRHRPLKINFGSVAVASRFGVLNFIYMGFL